VPVSTGIDSEMLRVVARAVLLHNERLMAEGLSRSAVECAVFHARVLTTATCDTTGVDGTEARHGRALQQVLGTLTGPASTTLLIWLDEALGPRP